VKVETRIFLFLGLFYIPVGIVYGFMTHWHEPLGYLALFLTSIMATMISLYFRYTARHIDARPEDDVFGEIASGAGEYGQFPPYSMWPLCLGFGAALLAAGLAAGWWLFFIGLPITLLSVVGWVFEYHRGEFAH
jgi:hypothetical protein